MALLVRLLCMIALGVALLACQPSLASSSRPAVPLLRATDAAGGPAAPTRLKVGQTFLAAALLPSG